MFGWMKRSEPSRDPSPPLRVELDLLDRQAEKSPFSEQAKLFNRGGDLCVQAGETATAKEYYGRAIDAYLDAEAYGPAAAMCRKLVRFAPDVVRAHCTLAFLAVGDRQFGDAEREIREYLRLTRETRTEKYAVPRLRLMAQATANPAVRKMIGEGLIGLGDEVIGERIRASALSEDGLADVPPDPEQEWRRLIRVVTMHPHELWASHWTR